jgi:hypothetical protein
MCAECPRLEAEADRIRIEYRAALKRLHAALDALAESTHEYQKSKAVADDLGQKYDLALSELVKHRRTHLTEAPTW